MKKPCLCLYSPQSAALTAWSCTAAAAIAALAAVRSAVLPAWHLVLTAIGCLCLTVQASELPAGTAPDTDSFTPVTFADLLPPAVSATGTVSTVQAGSAGAGSAAAAPMTEDQVQQALLSQDRLAGSVNPALNHKKISIQGFVVPLDFTDGRLTQFLLVPYFGACIHVPPPPANQIIFVTLQQPWPEFSDLSNMVEIRGTLQIAAASTTAGQSAYLMQDARLVMPHSSISWQQVAAALCCTLLSSLGICAGWFGPAAKIRVSPGLSGLALACAAGIMCFLGAGELYIEHDRQSLLYFAGGAAGLLLLFTLLHLLHKAKESRTRPAAPAFPCTHAHAGTSADCSRSAGASGAAEHIPVACALALHTFPESLMIFSSAMTELYTGLSLSVLMLAHNLPLGLSFALGLKKSSRHIALYCTLLAGVLPAVLAGGIYLGTSTFLSRHSLSLLTAAAGGALCCFALTRMLPHAWQHVRMWQLVCSFVCGLAAMAVSTELILL